MDKNLLEITGYDGEGYVPLIDYSHWRVAELRYCEELEVDKLKDMQKHDETDEVFVLLEGDFTLFLGGNGEHIGEIEAIKLEPLKLYNLKEVHIIPILLKKIQQCLLLKMLTQLTTIHLKKN